MVCCYVDYFRGIECVLIGKIVFIEKRINDMVNNIIGENEFLFLVIIDLICKNGRMRFLGLLNLILKDGFLCIIERDFDNWLEYDDISEK